jgi:hypothetical protein
MVLIPRIHRDPTASCTATVVGTGHDDNAVVIALHQRLKVVCRLPLHVGVIYHHHLHGHLHVHAMCRISRAFYSQHFPHANRDTYFLPMRVTGSSKSNIELIHSCALQHSLGKHSQSHTHAHLVTLRQHSIFVSYTSLMDPRYDDLRPIFRAPCGFKHVLISAWWR